MAKDAAIILSGGMDSITMLYEYKDIISLAITFDYGSNHNKREIEYASLHCTRLGIRHIIIPLEFMHNYFKSSLLEGADAIPEGNYNNDNMKSTVVPFRNGIMLAIACGIAESNNLHRVLIANHGGDHTIYPDCRQEFIAKTDIAQHGARLGLDCSETYSCYKGGLHHCGKCGTCVERREALAEAGVTDTTIYDN